MRDGTPFRAILFLDLAQFTALTDVHGDQVAVDVYETFMGCVRKAVADGRARIVKSLGDGALIDADDPDAAIEVAINAVELLHHLPDLPDVRGGVHAGPVVVRGGDVFGGTVNLASRLAGLAGPGMLCATTEPARTAAAKGLSVEPQGPTWVRGLIRPVDLFAVALCGTVHATVVDPVCGMRIVPGPDTPYRGKGADRVLFCETGCAEHYAADPARFVEPEQMNRDRAPAGR